MLKAVISSLRNFDSHYNWELLNHAFVTDINIGYECSWQFVINKFVQSFKVYALTLSGVDKTLIYLIISCFN